MYQLSPLTPDTIIVRCDGLIEAEIDNEIVALNIKNGMCYGLNGVGSQIWRMLAAPIKITDLCAALVMQYDVDPRVCERQVLDLLEELRAERMIGIKDAAVSLEGTRSQV
jgi:hypothetical protein